MSKLLLLNGPNLNLLGTREPEIYGATTLADIEQQIVALGEQAGITVVAKQSNAEHELVTAIQQERADIAIINPAAYTHTSVAIRDAFLATATPFIEVHLSNVHAREPFRHHSYLSDVAIGVICGLGAQGYEFAFSAAVNHLRTIDN